MIDEQLLNAVPALRDFKKQERDILAHVFTVKTFPQKARIFQIGDWHEYVGWVIKGTVEIRHAFSEYTHALIGVGEALSEHALLLDHSQHAQTAVALTETTLLQATIIALKKLKKEHQDIYTRLIEIAFRDLSSRLTHSANKLYAIHEMSALINAPALTPTAFAQRTLDIILSVIETEQSLFGIVDPYHTTLKLLAKKNTHANADTPTISLSSDAFLAHSIKSRRMAVVESQQIQKNPVWYISHNGLIAPLSNQKKILGVIILSHKLSTPEFTANNMILMEIIATLASSKIDEYLRLREKIAEEEHQRTSIYF